MTIPKIHAVNSKAAKDQISEMISALESYIKVAVDIRKGVLAGGGVMHADCERVLLDAGSKQGDIWGADWYPKERRVAFGSLINIPRQFKKGVRLKEPMQIQDPAIRQSVERIIRKLLEI